MDTNPLHYLPIASTIVAALFAHALYLKWKEKPDARYLMWWMIGIALYGVGTFTEAMTTLFGWSEPMFRAWYISGALLGGGPLATGTAYLVLKKSTADRIAVIMVAYVAMASAFVLATPIDATLAESHRLSGEVIGWQWVRLFSPLVNVYALIMLVGGAAWSAWKYWKVGDASSRVLGNIYIAVGALLPGIGGTFARMDVVEALYVTELLGLIFIWTGFRVISGDRVMSVFAAQRHVAVEVE